MENKGDIEEDALVEVVLNEQTIHKFMNDDDDTCKDNNVFNDATKKIIIDAEAKLDHKALKCMKVSAIEGLRRKRSGIMKLIDNYRFYDKNKQGAHLNLEKSLFEGDYDTLLKGFQTIREKEKAKQEKAIGDSGANFLQKKVIKSAIGSIDKFLTANEARIVGKANYLNEYMDFMTTILLLGFHNNGVDIKSLQEQVDYLYDMQPVKKETLKNLQRKHSDTKQEESEFREKVYMLEHKLNQMEEKFKNIGDSKPSSLVESTDIERKLGILFQIQNKLANDIDECCEKKEGKPKSSAKNVIEKLKCMFRRSPSQEKSPEDQKACNAAINETLQALGAGENTQPTYVIGGRKKTRRKRVSKNKKSLKRKYLKFRKIKGGKRFNMTKKKRNKRSRKIYYNKKH